MKTKFRKEKSNPSIISKIDPHIENLGVLTPVHIQDIVKDKNLDYLESLGQLVQRTQANPMWFQYQSNENKMKFLQVYQLSINYARNTEDIYNNVLNQLDQQFLIRKNKVDKLKSDILAHKDKTNKLKKHFQKQKLLKEKQKVLKYEKNIRNIRDNLIKQKKQIQAKNQRLMQQQRLEQQQLLKQAQKNKNHSNPYPYKSDPHYYPQPPPPYGYPYGAYPYAPPPPYYHPQQSNPNIQQNLQEVKPQNILQMFNLSLNPKNKNMKQQIKNEQAQQESFDIMPQQEQTKKSKKQQERQNKILNKLSKKDQIKQSIKLSKKQSIKQSSKKSDTNSGQQKNSNKAWTLGNSTNNINNIRDSYAGSQTQDVVKDLEIHAPISSIQKKLSDSSKMSQMSKRKQSDLSDQDLNSMINIQLKTQSQNDVYDQFQKKNKIKRVESIAEEIQQKQKPKKPIHSVDTISDEQKQQQKEKSKVVKKYDNKMSIKVSKQKQSPPSSMVDSVTDSRKNYSYLQQSNQGDRTKGIQFLGLNKLKVKDIDKIGHSHGHSLMNSLEDVQSKHQSQSRVQIADDYSQSGFQDYQDLALTMNTKKKLGPQISSLDKQKKFQYLPLLKNTFILKQDAISFNESKYSSGIGSLKDFSVKFVGSQKKKTFQDKSQQGLSDYGDDMMDLIEMPMDSCIAKPSKLKQSTIKKSTIQQKIHKSYDPKSNDSKPGQFVPETPIKHVRFSSKDNLDDNFADIKDFDKLNSKNMAKNNNNLLKPPVANKPQQKLLMSVTQSHVIQQDLVETKSEKMSDEQKQLAQSQSINLSVIQQNENQSVNTDNSVKQNILLLIHKKYKQKGAQQYNNGIITKEINNVMKDRKDLSLQEIQAKFNQLSKNLQLQIAALGEKRKKKKSSKDGQPVKQKSKQSSRQNSLKIIKNQKSNPIPKPKKTQQDELDDDLTYSRSILENPNDLKLKSTQSKIYKKSQIIKKPDNKPTNQGQIVNPNSKYLREQADNKNKNSSTNMAISLAEVDKYNTDDQLTNALKNFAVNQLEIIKQKDIDDDQIF